jgi:hypothetical protein
VPEYRIYTTGPNRHFTGVEITECADDQEAIQAAQKAANGPDIELWERGRLIARFHER